MESLVQIGGAAGLTVALVQVAKQLVPDHRWWPLLAIVTGAVLTVAYVWATARPDAQGLVAAALQGAAAGLLGSGAWSGARATAGK